MTTKRYYSSVAQDTTLSTSATSGDTSVIVSATTGWPTQYPFTLALDYGTTLEEIVDVTNVAGLTAYVTRGVDSSTAVGHSAGAVVRHVVIARDAREANILTSLISANGTADISVNGVVVGRGAGNSITNNAIGGSALRFNTTGTANTAVGTALYSNTSGAQQTGVGYSALAMATTGSDNTAVGSGALTSVVTTSDNTAVGGNAATAVTGGQNTAIGSNSGSTATTGSNNTLLGYNAQPSAIGVSNEFTLGDANVTRLRVPGLATNLTSALVGINDTQTLTNKNLSSATNTFPADGAWTSYTPATTNITIGNGTVSGSYKKTGSKTAVVRIRFLLGSTSAIVGTGALIAPPFPAAVAGNDSSAGLVAYYDTSASSLFLGSIAPPGYLTYTGVGNTITTTVPFTWAVGDSIYSTYTYELA